MAANVKERRNDVGLQMSRDGSRAQDDNRQECAQGRVEGNRQEKVHEHRDDQ